jgi:hypothetical protein
VQLKKSLLVQFGGHFVNCGAFFSDKNTFIGVICLDMIDAFCFPQLDEINNPDMFWQDRAPPQFSNTVQDTLNDKFPDRWIGRSVPILWPPCSPNLTASDFFM